MSNDFPIVPAPRVAEVESGDFLMTSSGFAHAMGVATALSRSTMIPDNFRGKPEDILIAMNMARRMNEDLFVVLSALHFIHGRPGWSAAFMIARANASGIFRNPLEFDVQGEGREMAVTCSAVLAGTGKPVSSQMTMATAVAEGWAGKNKRYQTLGAQMLSYRAATMLIRLYGPGLLFGMRTEDENEDIGVPVGRPIDRITVEPEPEKTRTSRRQALVIAADPTPEHLALAADVAQGRQTAEVVEAPVVEPVDPKAEARAAREAEKAARQASHDPSWTDNGRAGQKAFFAKANDLELNTDIVCDLAETVGTKVRPSAMSAERRAKFLGWLETPTGMAAYDAVVEERGRTDVELDEVVAEPAADGAESTVLS